MLKLSADPEQCDTIKDYEIYFEYQLPQSDVISYLSYFLILFIPIKHQRSSIK